MNEKYDSRKLFNDTAVGVKTGRPPFWLMRQAGRYLPEYRELKAKYGFLGIVKTPEVAVEAALQPIRRFGFDCAIVFSDILAVAEALGFPYDFRDGGGIVLSERISDETGVNAAAARSFDIVQNLSYVGENVKLLRHELPHTAVLGFCGAPWTLAAYIVEGESSVDFPKFNDFAKRRPDLLKKLLSILAGALSKYLQMQIDAGVDAVQIFDSHASLAPLGKYEEFSGKYISEISVNTTARKIVFAPRMSDRLEELAKVEADAFSLDSSVPLSRQATFFKGKVLQGNLDPSLLSKASPDAVSARTENIVRDMHALGGHVFNLGHGIRPDAKIENVEAMCLAVKNFKE